MDLRLYTPADCDACLAVCNSIAAELRDNFAAFLDQPGEFYVAEHDGAVIACGGLDARAQPPCLQWGMVHRDWQRKGVGRFLLLYRMRQLSRMAPSAEFVAVTAPAAAQGFYEKLGFRVAATPREDGLVEMIKRLAVCA